VILTVAHVTTYRYDREVRGAVQSIRIFPSDCEGQRTLDWEVMVDGGLRGGRFTDGAGDLVEGWSIRGPVSEVAVRVSGTVETTDSAGVLRGHREVLPPHAWLRPTPPIRPDAGLSEMARGAVAGAGDPLERAHRLAGAVAGAIAYRPGATDAHTTAAEALAQGEGVCQDHAQALIACAHAIGQPARYVSGYLFATEDGTPHEAAHAWAELWVEGLGWVGFDPANGCCPDARYIRLASGHDARDAAPIRGIALGMADETLDVSVAVQAGQQ